MKQIVFFDTEINPKTNEILDLGAVDNDGRQFHSANLSKFAEFIYDYEYIGGHNILVCDLKFLEGVIVNTEMTRFIDTLCLSPLLFPSRPYHRLLKDDKLNTETLSNPLNDSVKSMELFCDEIEAFKSLDEELKEIYYSLLHKQREFSGFFEYMHYSADIDVETAIHSYFRNRICFNKHLDFMIANHPTELAYCLAIISSDDKHSITPPWVLKNYPLVENYMRVLRNNPCTEGCEYCRNRLDVHIKLKEIFGYDEFRKYNGEPLQEKAADAAVHNKSLLAIFPTGGGKSITFQLPALMAGENARGLTVVISPLQSLMKDQVDNLAKMGIADAVTINGLLSPVERAEALERVQSGLATLLYISPESLRSKTIERLLLSRNVVRFVIDEAHCFSAWGQDFRVDYLYIGEFIKNLQQKKNISHQIPVSCFTATAKQKVISDICDYFKQKLDIDLEIYATTAARTNLRYEVIFKETDEEKYASLRSLIEQKDCPTIVYVSRTRRTFEIAAKLTEDGFTARPFNGKMENSEKIENQEAFIAGDVQIIVATSAFGMGVDKKDVKLVVHYDISDSLENYVQEAGRAGRDPKLDAECYVLFNENDLDKHFMLLNQTKLSQSEIQQVWRAIKNMTRNRPFLRRSALEIAREAGWDESGNDVETRVKTAISALENAGYVKRGMNSPRVFATSILAKDMAEASEKIRTSSRFNEQQKQNSLRIIKSLISSRSIADAGNDEAESRVDYISDILGIPKEEVIESINLMREQGLLADTKDMTAYIKRTDTTNKSLNILTNYLGLEKLLISMLSDERQLINLKEINEIAEKQRIKGASVKSIKTLLYFWTIKGYVEKTYNASDNVVEIIPKLEPEIINAKYEKRAELCEFIVKHLYEKARELTVTEREENLVEFSELELKDSFMAELSLTGERKTDFREIQTALLYLAKTESLTLEGGFLVLYNAMEIKRLELDNRIQYKNDDYKQLNEFYKQKIQQIHIVGEYANMMVKSYNDALQFVSDYFNMDYKGFLSKYFKGDRLGEINRNITPEKYDCLFGSLSPRQREIIEDDTSKYIVVAAGPGSGKTRVLVHKLAALVLLDDIKYEQLLMLTFSRAAATEFRHRIIELIGGAAKFLEIKTFHSYCFDLLGKIGNIEASENIVRNAAEMIRNGEVESGRITKTVVVIDEAQDMDNHEFSLIQALMERNEDMRVIAVGDDDQNIYEFRGSDSKNMRLLIDDFGAKKYDLLDNYRSAVGIVDLANRFAPAITERLKNEPINAISENQGIVRFIKHKSRNLEYPIVRNIMSNFTDDKTICVLTSTNDEALRVTGLLKKQSVPAKLIQSNDGFNLYNMAELRMFMKLVTPNSDTPIISDKQWNYAVNELKQRYESSSCLELCINLLDTFASVNERKYKSDLETFIRESQLSDFYEREKNEVIVSTVHKSKGREFDCVYMLLNGITPDSDDVRRSIYVGMTRAKSELYMHYNNDAFDEFADSFVTDNIIYPEPNEIMLQLSLSDVFLGYFKDKKKIVLSLRSGQKLDLKGKYLYADVSGKNVSVAMLSKAAQETLERLYKKGYAVKYSKIRFVVAWYDKNDQKEYAVILPDIYLEKRSC